MSKVEDRYLEHFQDGRLRNCSSKEVFLLGYHQAEKDVAEAFARIIRGNLSMIDKSVQDKFEQLYTDVIGEKNVQGIYRLAIWIKRKKWRVNTRVIAETSLTMITLMVTSKQRKTWNSLGKT